MSYACLSAYYDSLTEDVDYQSRADYLWGFLKQYKIQDGILLDLACGTGQMSLLFAQKGYEVIGVDASPEMLCQARENVMAAGQDNILFLCQRMEELDLYGTVRSCICTLDSLNHLTTPEQVLTAFKKVALFLEPGGVFLFDVNTPYKHRQVLGDHCFVLEDEALYLVWQNQYDSSTETVEITLDLFEEEAGVYYRQTERFAERAYETAQLRSLLEEAGFSLEAVYDDLTLNAPGEDSQRLYMIARK